MPFNTFAVEVRFKGRQQWAAFVQRLGSFKVVFDAIIDRWVGHNVEKFEASKGAETTGYYFDDDVAWLPLKSDAYRAQKRRDGYEDWLMVRTGELKDSLTSRDSGPYWYEDVGDEQATFGTLDRKAEWNAATRPVMFLDGNDRAMILEMFGSYMEGEPPFRPFVGTGQVMDREYKGIFQWA